MFSIKQKKTFLLLLTAMLLLLQSFAVWHDVEHPFHDSQAQCERLNAINHLPGLDLFTEVNIATTLTTVSLETVVVSHLLPAHRRQQHPIRAPPFFS